MRFDVLLVALARWLGWGVDCALPFAFVATALYQAWFVPVLIAAACVGFVGLSCICSDRCVWFVPGYADCACVCVYFLWIRTSMDAVRKLLLCTLSLFG